MDSEEILNINLKDKDENELFDSQMDDLKELSTDDNNEKLENLKCDHCEKTFKTNQSYRTHMVFKHGVTINCPVCEKQFTSK